MPSAEDYEGEEMTLWEHLEELRSRLFKAALALMVTFIVGFLLNEFVFDILIKPYCSLDPSLRVSSAIFDDESCRLVFSDVLGAFKVRLKAASVIAITFGGPVVFYQLWAFIVPGLKAQEKKYAAPFFFLSQFLFLLGAAFSYFVIPKGLEFLLSFGGSNLISLMDADRYISFLIRTMIGFGVSFEYPLLVAILVLMGVVSHAWLKEYRRHAFFGAFVAAAVITPSQDPATMIVMALPLALFYEICIVFAKFVERGRGADVDPEVDAAT
ncbi:MAG: twin-arginine translocase subunit TatC [Actinomycetota bacterium]|jgi:sec-independent protein translocase protein TatC|uniref:twin-arginine translocase subunit TatC n=1 Tax=Euzebya pacifica TaxID=1608957 RepID=UPI0030F7BFB5